MIKYKRRFRKTGRKTEVIWIRLEERQNLAVLSLVRIIDESVFLWLNTAFSENNSHIIYVTDDSLSHIDHVWQSWHGHRHEIVVYNKIFEEIIIND